MNHISWQEYFMFSAVLTSKRSKDPSTQVGAVIVNEDNRIVGTGYNGFPNGISDKDLPWTKDSKLFEETKYAYVVHAETNCLLNSISLNLKECTMYVTLFPCSSCTKLIIQRGIKKIVFANYPKDIESSDNKASIKMLDLARINYKLYDSINNSITLNTK